VCVAGNVYRWDNHPWIVISNPGHQSGKLLIVNLTSLDEECPDTECTLNKSDYAWIDHPTVVAFSRAKIVDEAQFIKAITANALKEGHPKTVPPACLAKIQAAARASREMAKIKKNLIPKEH
jgi:hypothetical protein